MKADGQRLQHARRVAGLSARDLAGLVNVTHLTVRKWECGIRDIPFKRLRELAELLDTTVSYLIGDEAYDEPFRRFTGEIPYRHVDGTAKKTRG
jgi:transcriptional regulator with XRE-family HTH domain